MSSNSQAPAEKQASRGQGQRAGAQEEEEVGERTARNREIQARYRRKQREKQATLVTQHEAAAADVARARAEQEGLEHRIAALGSILQYREEMISALQETREGGEGSRGQNQGPGPVLRALVPACMQCSLGEGKLHRPSAWVVDTAEEQEQEQGRGGGDSNPQAPGATAAAAAVPLTTSLLQELVPAAPKVSSAGDIAQQQQQQQELQVQPWQLHDPLARVANELGAQLALLAQDAEGRGKPSGQGFNSLAALSQLPVGRVAVEEVSRCTPQHFMHSYATFVAQARDRLAEYDMTKSSTVLQGLKLYMESWGVLVGLLLLHNPEVVRQMLAAKLQGEETEAEAQQKWDAVVAAMGLSPSERKGHLAIYDTYVHRMGCLRAHLSEALKLVSEASMDVDALEAAGLSQMMVAYMRAFEGATRLAGQADLELVASLQMMRDATMLWSTAQKARVVTAAPNFPDMVQLMKAIQRVQAEGDSPAAAVDLEEAARAEEQGTSQLLALQELNKE